MKKTVANTGFLQIFMKKIKKEKSERHIKIFSKVSFLELISKTLNLVKSNILPGLHIIT